VVTGVKATAAAAAAAATATTTTASLLLRPISPPSASGGTTTPAAGANPRATQMVGPPAPAVLVDTIHAAAAAAAAHSPSECAVCAGTADEAYTHETLCCKRCALPVHPRCYGLRSAADAGANWMCWVCKAGLRTSPSTSGQCFERLWIIPPYVEC
jgi:hypothetical protein